MRRIALLLRLLLAATAVVLLSVSAAGASPGQDDLDNEPAVPSGGIVPEPNSGREPTEAGDRGGALQLMLPALMIAAVGAGAWHISRQARAAREAGPRAQPSSDSQAANPSMNPER